MGIIRALKSNELVGGSGDEYVYPVTSIKAIYDLNDKALDTIIEEQNVSIEHTYTKTSKLEGALSAVNGDMNSIRNVQTDLQSNINTIQNTVHTLESVVAQKNNQNNYIVAKITVDNSVSRGMPENVSHNLQCYSPVKLEECVSNDQVTDYIQNIKDGEIVIPTKPGTYVLNNEVVEVSDYSLIQKQGEDFVVISLGIPMPPYNADGTIEPGKILTTNSEGIYWA